LTKDSKIKTKNLETRQKIRNEAKNSGKRQKIQEQRKNEAKEEFLNKKIEIFASFSLNTRRRRKRVGGAWANRLRKPTTMPFTRFLSI
jgi:hypothetical protein